MSEKKKKFAVSVDLDGVLAQYDGTTESGQGVDSIGPPIEGAQGFIAALLAAGFKVRLFTTRVNPEVNSPEEAGKSMNSVKWLAYMRGMVRQWVVNNGFPDLGDDFAVYEGPGKPLAIAYIDDRAVRCVPQEQDRPATEYAKALRACQFLRAEAELLGPVKADEMVDRMDSFLEGLGCDAGPGGIPTGALSELLELVDLAEKLVPADRQKTPEGERFIELTSKLATLAGRADANELKLRWAETACDFAYAELPEGRAVRLREIQGGGRA